MNQINNRCSDHVLFQSFSLGSLTLSNRMVTAPLTRSRAGIGDVQSELNATYYAQRATAGLIKGKGYAFTPGIYSEAQITG
jgi:N-ethylmaleimide reductase